MYQSKNVAISVYFASTHTMYPSTSPLLVIAMERAQRPVQLVAGGVVYMSMENFGNVRNNIQYLPLMTLNCAIFTQILFILFLACTFF